jgi:pimeloyl-ACP methyl ester carboxylesterase
MTQHAISKDGTSLAYEVVGQGPPLVYVMGALGTRAIAFSTAMREELAKSFTLYFYDRRGRGESDAKSAGDPVAREVEDLRTMCEVAGGSPIVCGSSSGAALALEAVAAGVPMGLLVAHEPPYAVGEHAASFDRSYQANVTRLVAEGKNGEAVKYFMRTVGVPGPMVWLMRFMPFWKDAVAAAPSLPYDAAIMGDFSLPEKRLREIRTPTIVLVGGSTAPRLRAAADAVAKVVPGAREVVVPKQNHGIKPAALRQALVDATKEA